jgi:hypothetical protein
MQTELVFDADDLIARRVGRHDESGNALLAGVGIGYGKDDDDIAVLARRDELLGTIDDVMITRAAGAGTEIRCIRPGLRFRQGKTTDPFAGGQFRKESLLLLFRAEFQDRHTAN